VPIKVIQQVVKTKSAEQSAASERKKSRPVSSTFYNDYPKLESGIRWKLQQYLMHVLLGKMVSFTT
jgi:hypothetical protein